MIKFIKNETPNSLDQYVTILSYESYVYELFIYLELIMNWNALLEQQSWNDDICKIFVSIYDELDQLTFWHVFIWSLNRKLLQHTCYSIVLGTRKIKAQDTVYKESTLLRIISEK